MHDRSRPSHPLLLAALLLVPATLTAQSEEREAPNREPSADETLFEQSDLGNVAQAARFSWAAGDRELQAARKLERRADEAPDETKRDELLAKRTTALERAVGHFEEAIGYNPRLLDAYTGLGTALRGLDRHADALRVHARALELDDGREEDFRGWAEALLGLDMLGDATTAYGQLVATRPDRAAILMDEMKAWLAEKRQDPGELRPEDVQRLADWIAAQEAGAG